MGSILVAYNVEPCEKECMLCGEKIHAWLPKELYPNLTHHLQCDCAVMDTVCNTECQPFLEEVWGLLGDDMVAERVAKLSETYPLLKRLSQLAQSWSLQALINLADRLDEESTRTSIGE